MDKAVYKSDMIWPTKQHEIIYICLGMEASCPVDERCRSSNMTVVFTENYLQDQRDSNTGTLRRLSVRRFNDFLTQKEIVRRSKMCNCECQAWSKAIFVATLVAGMLVLNYIILFIVIKCKRRSSNTTLDSTSSSAPPRQPYYGKKFHCSYLTADTVEEARWIVLVKQND